LNTRLEVENFIANLAAEYFNYVQQNIRLNNLKYTVQLSEERLRIVEARYQIGSLSRLDFQQAKVDFNADSSLLIQQYEILNASRIKLNELMGVENVEQPFVTEDTLIYFNADLSKDKLYESMLSENTLLKLVEKDKVLSELDLKTLQSQNYPYLKLVFPNMPNKSKKWPNKEWKWVSLSAEEIFFADSAVHQKGSIG
jgi:outer membrane protein TolC